MTDTQADFERELAQLAAESMGWHELEAGVYLHVSDVNAMEITIVGTATPGSAVLWVSPS